ncbi:MAG TPA: MFS transporter [Pseudomonadota bacterium]|nr:MFS transporter [Pseudomonadota bacterium]
MQSTSGRATPALVWLCVVQGCERFAFTAILPLFVLYLHRRHGLTEPTALLVLGLFNALSYVGGLPGGMLTDHRLGPTTGLLLGVALLTLGHALLASDVALLLWPALAIVVAGHSLFRPSMTTLIGATSSTDAGRDRSFLIQYLAINVAGIVGPLCAERTWAGAYWPRLFTLATIVLLLGALLLASLASRLPQAEPQPLPMHREGHPDTNTRDRWRAVWLLSALAVVFWLTAMQPGGSLALFAESNTARSITLNGHSIRIGPTDFASLHGLLVIALLPAWGLLATWLREHDAEPSTPLKMVWGYVFTSAAFALLAAVSLRFGDGARVHPGWLLGCYILLSIAEIFLGPLSMSLITRLAPAGRSGQAIGLWFAAGAVGNVAAGLLGLLWSRWPHGLFFAVLAAVSLCAAGVLLLRTARLDAVLRNDCLDESGGRR